MELCFVYSYDIFINVLLSIYRTLNIRKHIVADVIVSAPLTTFNFHIHVLFSAVMHLDNASTIQRRISMMLRVDTHR